MPRGRGKQIEENRGPVYECRREGCAGDSFKNGLCRGHYETRRKFYVFNERGVRCCEKEGCSKRHYAKGLCDTHYAQLPETKANLKRYQEKYYAREDIKERERGYHAEYCRKNKEKRAAYQRAYRARKKAEKQQKEGK